MHFGLPVPSKGLLLISRAGGLPAALPAEAEQERRAAEHPGDPGRLTTVIATGYALIPTVSSAYWIFSVITTQVYLIMYLLMFVAAVRLRRNDPDHPRGYRAPILVSLCGVGFAASPAALLVGFIPPSQFGSGSRACTSSSWPAVRSASVCSCPSSSTGCASPRGSSPRNPGRR